MLISYFTGSGHITNAINSLKLPFLAHRHFHHDHVINVHGFCFLLKYKTLSITVYTKSQFKRSFSLKQILNRLQWLHFYSSSFFAAITFSSFFKNFNIYSHFEFSSQNCMFFVVIFLYLKKLRKLSYFMRNIYC